MKPSALNTPSNILVLQGLHIHFISDATAQLWEEEAQALTGRHILDCLEVNHRIIFQDFLHGMTHAQRNIEVEISSGKKIIFEGRFGSFKQCSVNS